MADPADTELAWHDVVCFEAEECDFRAVHARSMPVVSTGILERYHARLDQIRAGRIEPLRLQAPLFDYAGAKPKKGHW